MKDFENSKYLTLRIAGLKKEGNNLWANLKNVSMGELSEVIDGNALSYFKKIGATTVDYKIDVFEQLGTGSKQLVVIFPKNNDIVPIQAFIVTRIIALLNEMRDSEKE